MSNPLRTISPRQFTYDATSIWTGKVDSADYSRLKARIASQPTTKDWINGDINYDGKIDSSDYSKLKPLLLIKRLILPISPRSMPEMDQRCAGGPGTFHDRLGLFAAACFLGFHKFSRSRLF